jgi:hypothetical protein
MAHRIRRFVLPVALILVCLLFHSEGFLAPTPQNEILPGTLVEKVVTQADPDQSYAIYLPSKYSTKQKWPTIFCFDPMARGKHALERLQAAAEKFGYVVACSNNSRNGLDANVVTKIVTAFWRDLHDRFAVDEQRTYFAGLSGGARLSVGLANRCNGCVAGVFATGAGYPGDQEPNAKTTFAFVGAVGYDDFNFDELRDLENKFESLPVPNRFYYFAGGHEWSPASVFERALAWFSLQSMKRGTLAKDEKFLDERFTAEMNEADRLLGSQQLVEARSVYTALVRDFDQLRDTSAVSTKLAELKAFSELKKQLQQESELHRRQLKEVYEIRGLWMKPRLPDEDLSSRSAARGRIRDWIRKKDANDDSKERRLARRILASLRVGGYESAREAMHSKNYSVAVANMELVQVVDPTSPNAMYELARALALNNDKRGALSALEEAVQLGFKDAARMKNEPAFSSLTSDARFQKLVSSLN